MMAGNAQGVRHQEQTWAITVATGRRSAVLYDPKLKQPLRHQLKPTKRSWIA